MGKLLYFSVHQPPNRKKEDNRAFIVDHLAEIMPIKCLIQCQMLDKNKTIAHCHCCSPNIKEEEVVN